MAAPGKILFTRVGPRKVHISTPGKSNWTSCTRVVVVRALLFWPQLLFFSSPFADPEDKSSWSFYEEELPPRICEPRGGCLFKRRIRSFSSSFSSFIFFYFSRWNIIEVLRGFCAWWHVWTAVYVDAFLPLLFVLWYYPFFPPSVLCYFFPSFSFYSSEFFLYELYVKNFRLKSFMFNPREVSSVVFTNWYSYLIVTWFLLIIPRFSLPQS